MEPFGHFDMALPEFIPDTIYALATAPGRAGVAIIRLSGPGVAITLQSLTQKSLPSPRKATLRTLFDAAGTAIDQALVVWFPGPASYTGEDVGELHIHGSRAVLAAILTALASLAGLRLATPGEFTRRAFEHGKMDLTEIEGLADLIAAETEAQRRQALRQMEGSLGQLYESWRCELIALMAKLEAAIDFPEEDLPPDLLADLGPRLSALGQAFADHLSDSRRGERLREGFSAVLLGPPNAGKSSLMNALSQRDVAIVSATAGTTRDILEAHLDVGGWPLILADTAGLREAVSEIEAEGMRRALRRAESADLRLLLFDAADWPETLPMARILKAAKPAQPGAALWILLTKMDLRPELWGALPDQFEGHPLIPLSVADGAGMQALIAALTAWLQQMTPDQPHQAEAPVLTRARHREAVTEALVALQRASCRLAAAETAFPRPLIAGSLEAGQKAAPPAVAFLARPPAWTSFASDTLGIPHLAMLAPELLAEDLRVAARALGRITGRIDIEDVLDQLFAEFCIGK